MSNLFVLVLFQAVALVAVIELFVRCMPRSLRRASTQNCYRLDGTLSDHRSYREWRAHNRLRRDLLAVFVLVFLTGNALYFTVDKTIVGVPQAANMFWQKVAGGNDLMAPHVESEFQGALQAASGARDPTSLDAAWSDLRQKWPMIIVVGVIWFIGCCAFVGWGAMRSYHVFADGVNARSAEHFHLDMTRMSISSSAIVDELSSKSPTDKPGPDMDVA
ncbi:MAG: hypothetical protein IT423_15285 [Pirellulaceae bacterium]|nr:hypothetical protein [Pirellulaceae bacterium]